LKGRLVFLHHFLESHQDLGSETREELIQAVIYERDLLHAKQVIEKTKESGMVSMFVNLISGWSLKKEMKKMASAVSDPDYLLELKKVNDGDLQSPINEAVALACTQLSTSIDAAVTRMIRAVLQMQQDSCKKVIQLEFEAEERKLLGDVLAAFIREINAGSEWGPS
jgi:hypothetical protein